MDVIWLFPCSGASTERRSGSSCGIGLLSWQRLLGRPACRRSRGCRSPSRRAAMVTGHASEGRPALAGRFQRLR